MPSSELALLLLPPLREKKRWRRLTSFTKMAWSWHLPPKHPAYIHFQDSSTAAQIPETRSLQFTYKLKFCTSINFSSTLFLSLGENRYIDQRRFITIPHPTPYFELDSSCGASLNVGGGSRAGSDSQNGGRRSSLRAGHESTRYPPKIEQRHIQVGMI